jgi:hypothetical protein
VPIETTIPVDTLTDAERLDQFRRGNLLQSCHLPELPKHRYKTPFTDKLGKATPEEQRKQVESQNPSRPSADQTLKALGLGKESRDSILSTCKKPS